MFTSYPKEVFPISLTYRYGTQDVPTSIMDAMTMHYLRRTRLGFTRLRYIEKEEPFFSQLPFKIYTTVRPRSD